MTMTRDFDAIAGESWAMLVAGAGDRRHPLHTPVVVSVDAGGRPQGRVLVLRAADAAAGRLRFHTDARSPKVAEMDGRPVSIVGYHPGAAVQLRLTGTARLADAATTDAAWQDATAFARRCYLAEAAPGTMTPLPTSGLPPAVAGRRPEEAELLPARRNFAVLLVTISEIDWLHLAQAGHRRARLRRGDGGSWSGDWLIP